MGDTTDNLWRSMSGLEKAVWLTLCQVNSLLQSFAAGPLIVSNTAEAVDRIVLGKTSLREKLNWTETTTAAVAYNEAIEAIRWVANASILTLAQWELQLYSQR